MARVPDRVLFDQKVRDTTDAVLPALNGASANLAVDGSVTPVEFTVSPNTNTYLYPDEFRYSIICTLPGVRDFKDLTYSNFFGITLTNGIKFDFYLNREIKFTYTFKSMCELFALPRLEKTQAFTGGTLKCFHFSLKVNTQFALNQDLNDKVVITIQDDMSAINFASVLLSGTEISFL